jgi:uncharacterized protein YndB with AHSA1/START domain
MSARAITSWTVTINRPPSVVFDYLADVTRHAEWSPKPYRVEGVSGPITTGDRFTSIGTIPGDKNHRNEVTVTACSAPSRLVLDAEEKGEHYVSTFDLQAQGSDTLLTRTMDAPKPRGLLALVFPLVMAVVIRPDVHKGLNNLKSILERG